MLSIACGVSSDAITMYGDVQYVDNCFIAASSADTTRLPKYLGTHRVAAKLTFGIGQDQI